MQTGNLVRGETTCERYGKVSYKQMHAMHQETMSLDQTYEAAVKTRMSIMSIDDTTNKGNVACGNLLGMCCNQRTMDQQEIYDRVCENY